MIWLTTIGQKPIAAVNTLWAALREEKIGAIEKIVVFYSEDMKRELLTFTGWAECLFTEYQKQQPKLQTVPFPTHDIKAFRTLIKRTISKIEAKILMDMTSGRKAMSALMLLIGDLFPGKVEKVYYSFLTDDDYMNFLYPTIPLDVTQLHNLTE
ncbi:MAG: hypothetical protein ACE5IR_25175 [bacterium]